MKIFLRTGAWYKGETKALIDDLDITDLLNESTSVTPKEKVVSCSCKNELTELHERIDVLTKWINDSKKEIAKDDKPASVTSKLVSKKDTAKKK